MKALFGTFLLTFAVTLTMTTNETQEVQISHANLKFAKDLFNILAEEQGNVFFSPISVHAALSMLLQGAQGTTAKALENALKFTDRTASMGYKNIMDHLNHGMPNVTTYLSNKIYVQENLSLASAFNSSVIGGFESEIETVDFAETEKAVNTINAWVEKKTQQKIQGLVSSDDLNEMTRLVLINAIYFKGSWEHMFDKKLTKKALFYETESRTVDVDMMQIEDMIGTTHIDDLEATAVQLPYADKDVSLYILLPDKRDGLKTLQEKIKNVDLEKHFPDLVKQAVLLKMPKFKIEQKTDLNAVLEKLGLGIIFEDRADFSGIGNEKLTVTKVLQKAFIEVNEEGAEAAAVTGIEAGEKSAPKIMEIEINHPFLFMLACSPLKFGAGSPPVFPLFVGRIEKI